MFRTHNRHNKIEQDNSCSYIQRGAKRQKEIECPHPTLRLVKNTRYGPSDRIRTCGILLPKQARYQLRYTRLLSCFIRLGAFSQSKRATNCATPRLNSFFLPLFCPPGLRFPKKPSCFAYSSFSTAARTPPCCIRHWRRSASYPKVQALPTALHPDFILTLLCWNGWAALIV